jgi:hypothetical protein
MIVRPNVLRLCIGSHRVYQTDMSKSPTPAFIRFSADRTLQGSHQGFFRHNLIPVTHGEPLGGPRLRLREVARVTVPGGHRRREVGAQWVLRNPVPFDREDQAGSFSVDAALALGLNRSRSCW